MDQQSLIFQRGQKSRLNKDLAAGQGIGLHSVSSVLNKAGGRVGVSSPHRWEYDGKEGNAGPGSRFWFEMKNESPVKGSTTNDLTFHHSYKNLDVLQEAKIFTGKERRNIVESRPYVSCATCGRQSFYTDGNQIVFGNILQ